MTPASSKAKGRHRVCRRCRQDYTPSQPLQKVCDDCRKTCSSCGVVLTKDNWGARGYETRKQFQCKACIAKGVRRRAADKKDYQRDYDLRRHYGITFSDYTEMYNAQGSACAICGESYPVLRVDHCHETGKVRGLLCNGCNRGLGFFNDSRNKLVKAARYLNDSKVSQAER